MGSKLSDSNKENQWPTANTDGCIPICIGECTEDSMPPGEQHSGTDSSHTKISKTTQWPLKHSDEPMVHPERNGSNIGQSITHDLDKQILCDIGNSQLLLKFITRESAKFCRSYKYLECHEDINAWITLISRSKGLALHPQDRARLAWLWGLLQDFWIVTALATNFTKIFNLSLCRSYKTIHQHCWITVCWSTNSSRTDQSTQTRYSTVHTSSKHGKVLWTSVEGCRNNTWGPTYWNRDPAQKIEFSHRFKEKCVVPEGHYALEIAELSIKVQKAATTLRGTKKWTNEAFPN